jgi:hypothetical protein
VWATRCGKLRDVRRNVFVMGLDDVRLAQLHRLRRAGEYRFIELFREEDVKSGREDVADRVLNGARRILADFDGPIDALVGYWDFPVSTMLPILRREIGLRTPTLESVLRCEHKYWSRLEQSRSVPECVPDFCLVDPFRDDVDAQITLPFPFWIKPVRSVKSHLGFLVRSPADLRHAVGVIRDGIHRLATPFDRLLEEAELPAELVGIGGSHCIAEGLISQGRQCTLEGYALDGEIVVYGAVDSVREGETGSSFSRYQYPSTLPSDVIDRMSDVTRRFLHHVGFDDSPFNIEFYWDESSDRIWLLEVNARHSKSHGPLFRLVDGEYHHQVMLDVALGERPCTPRRRGPFPTAAKFMWRVGHDAVVRRVPDRTEIDALREEVPGIEIQLPIREGMRLSALPYEDSYSYEIAVVHLGGSDTADLLTTYARCREVLGRGIELEATP